jgi:predicted amidophosphoribosyltransferase
LNLIYGRIYTIGEGYRFSDTNQQISNFKIKPSEPENRKPWKRAAIARFGEELTALLRAYVPDGKSVALIPMPPSKTAQHPDYDDRLLQVARMVESNLNSVRCWPVLECIVNRDSLHSGATQRTTAEVYRSIGIDESVFASVREAESLCVIDDVLTSGASFSAARKKLLERLPDRKISGVFWAKAEQAVSEDS